MQPETVHTGSYLELLDIGQEGKSRPNACEEIDGTREYKEATKGIRTHNSFRPRVFPRPTKRLEKAHQRGGQRLDSSEGYLCKHGTCPPLQKRELGRTKP